jgi:membrane protease YdiL (CAAX protease family)
MKKCPYCGKEYPDDVTVCAIDTETLVDYIPKTITDEKPVKLEPYLTFPDYQWSARDAWKGLGSIFLLSFIAALILIVIIRAQGITFSAYQSNAYGYFFLGVFIYTLELFPVIYFARTRTFNAFLNGFGFNYGISKYVWFGVIAALLIRFTGHFYGYAHTSDSAITSFKSTAGFEKFLFIIPMLVFAPIIEETIDRGFLYKAFRGSYSIEVCMSIMVAWTIITHVGECFHAPSVIVRLSALTIVQCYLREKSGSLWDCIICHFIFDATYVLIILLQR